MRPQVPLGTQCIPLGFPSDYGKVLESNGNNLVLYWSQRRADVATVWCLVRFLMIFTMESNIPPCEKETSRASSKPIKMREKQTRIFKQRLYIFNIPLDSAPTPHPAIFCRITTVFRFDQALFQKEFLAQMVCQHKTENRPYLLK